MYYFYHLYTSVTTFYDFKVVSNKQGVVDETCQPDASGRQICLKPFMYPTDVVNILVETGGLELRTVTCQGNSILVWSLTK